jgi:hypothetical protein
MYVRSSGMVLGGEDVLNGIGDELGHFYLHVVQTRTQDDQVTSAPRAVKVSMRTAVWMVLYRYHSQCYCYCCTVQDIHVETSSNTSTLQGLSSTVLS